MKIKIPAGQIRWVSNCDEKRNVVSIITSNAQKSTWYLYRVEAGGKLTKEATAKSPLAFGNCRGEMPKPVKRRG